MALPPFLIAYEHPSCPAHVQRPRLFDQDFGTAITPEDLLAAIAAPLHSRDYYRPWRQMSAPSHGSTIKSEKGKFHVTLDVQHFAPEEISVKVADGFIVVEGKHEEKKDEHGYISRQFTRKYALPEGCNPDAVESRLSSDGVLSVIAPIAAKESLAERNVPIAQTGPVRMEVKDQTSQAEDAANGEK